MPSYISLAVVSDINLRAVLREKLSYCVVPGYAAILTQSYYYLIL